MADHRFVELVVGWLENEWDTSNYPGSYDADEPAIVDVDDGASQEWNGRRVYADPTKHNVVEVSSAPDRTQSFIGTEADYRFEDGVAISIFALHEDEVDFPGDDTLSPGVSGAAEFQTLVDEVERIVDGHAVWPAPNGPGDQATHTLGIFDASNLSHRWLDAYEYDLTATVRGHKDR